MNTIMLSNLFNVIVYVQDRSGITHSNGMKKRFVTLTWTAPPEGTGAVVFKYAVVRSRKIYWADRQGPILQGELVNVK